RDWSSDVCSSDLLLAPGAGNGIDVEAQLLFVLTPAPAAVDTPDLRSRRISEFAQQFFAQPDFGFLLLNLAIGAGQETVGGLQLEALTLTFLVVDGDALGGYRLHGFDAIELAHPIVLGEQGITVLAAIDQRLFATRLTEMTVSALAAHQ